MTELNWNEIRKVIYKAVDEELVKQTNKGDLDAEGQLVLSDYDNKTMNYLMTTVMML